MARYNNLRTLFARSAADTEKTHTITMPTTGKSNRRIYIHSLTCTTTGGDIAKDTGIYVKDNGTTVWEADLRSAKVFGGHFSFPGAPIPIRAGDCTIVVDDAGTSVITALSCVYEII